MNADAHGSISMITISLEDHRTRRSGNPFIYHEEHKGKEEKMKITTDLKKFSPRRARRNTKKSIFFRNLFLDLQ
jgi:hypothetical protein